MYKGMQLLRKKVMIVYSVEVKARSSSLAVKYANHYTKYDILSWSRRPKRECQNI